MRMILPASSLYATVHNCSTGAPLTRPRPPVRVTRTTQSPASMRPAPAEDARVVVKGRHDLAQARHDRLTSAKRPGLGERLRVQPKLDVRAQRLNRRSVVAPNVCVEKTTHGLDVLL